MHTRSYDGAAANEVEGSRREDGHEPRRRAGGRRAAVKRIADEAVSAAEATAYRVEQEARTKAEEAERRVEAAARATTERALIEAAHAKAREHEPLLEAMVAAAVDLARRADDA